MNNPPLVSIILPCYNHQNYIVNCIESIYCQTYKNFELIVIDDGSKDNCPIILEKLQIKYGFTLEIQENIGVARTLTKGIRKYSKGKYVTFAASDDYWVSDKLMKQVEFMEENTGYPMCYGKAIVVDENNNERKKRTSVVNANLKGGYIFKELLLIDFHLPVTYLFRRTLFEEIGYYKENIWTEDFYMNLKIAERYPIGFINHFLTHYRIPMNKGKNKPNLKMVFSQLECINDYKHSEYYVAAIEKWHLRNFYVLSSFRSTKKQAIIGMSKNLDKFYIPGFIKSFFNLLFIWR